MAGKTFESARISDLVRPDGWVPILSVGARPGPAYRPRAWEVSRDVSALLDDGRTAEVEQALLDGLQRYDHRGSPLHNLACAEEQLGEAALEHLRTAVDESPSPADAAREDFDLGPIRPRLAELVSAS